MNGKLVSPIPQNRLERSRSDRSKIPFQEGDGGSSSSSNSDPSHTYTNPGQYHVVVTDSSGNVVGGNWVNVIPNYHPILTTVPDQIVSTGDAVDVSTTARDMSPNGVYEGYVDWGDCTGLHPTGFTDSGTSATLSAHLDDAGDPGQHSGSLNIYSANEPYNHSGLGNSAGFNVDVWGAKLGDGSNNIIMQASDDGTQNLVPLTLYYPRPAGVATNLKLTISNEGEAIVWDTADPGPDGTPVLSNGDSTASIDANAGDYQRTLWVGATEGTTTLNDLFFTLAAQAPGPTTGPTTKPTTNPATPIKIKIISNYNPNGDNGNNGDVTGKARNWLVGQIAYLHAEVDAPPAVIAAAKFKWTVPGSVLRSYTRTAAGAQSSAIATPLANDSGNAPEGGPATGLAHQDVIFFWVITSSLTQADVNDVSVQVSNLKINGNLVDPETGKTTFKVFSPTGTMTKTAMGTADVELPQQGGDYVVGLLPTAQQKQQKQGFGIKWTVSASTPNQGFKVGTIHDTQLVSSNSFIVTLGQKDVIRFEHELDNADPYSAERKVAPYNAPEGWSTDGKAGVAVDTPRAILGPNDTSIHFDESFNTYLMYLPPGPVDQTQWVPLQEMDWSFIVSADRVAGGAKSIQRGPWYIHESSVSLAIIRPMAEPQYAKAVLNG